ncbi:uncharacterized protein [Apostichopus japonicus]|uniref:uncharacterized protein n=1 Tax=Stichopus japonicus TaxID=307972 RepID=UPI003AB911E7
MDAYTSSSMSSEADDSEGKTSSYCFMHVIETDGRVIPFSEKSFNKFLECSTLWKELENRPESVIATTADGLQFDDVCTEHNGKYISVENWYGNLDRDFKLELFISTVLLMLNGKTYNSLMCPDYLHRKRQGRAGYHVDCYRHFCNLTSIRRAKDKAKKAQISKEADEEEPKAAGKGRCSCRQHNITCTDLCRCINCQNSAQAGHNMDEEDTDNEDED